MLGPANYDPECARARLATHGRLAVLLVMGGTRGNGVSVQVQRDSSGDLVKLPGILRALADEIDTALALPTSRAARAARR